MTADTESEQTSSPAAGSEPASERPPRRVFTIALMLLIWLAVPWGLVLATSLRGELVWVVCVVFTTIAFGICGIIVVQVLRGETGRRRKGAGDGGWLATYNGRLPMKAAVLQILLIPGSVAVGFTVLAVIDVIMRA